MKIKKSPIIALLVVLVAIVCAALYKNDSIAACGDGSLGSASTTVAVQETGNFRLWVRINQTLANNKSVQLNLNGSNCYNIGVTNTALLGSWNWVNYQNGDSSAVINVNVTNLTNNIKISGLEPGVKVDRIMLVPAPEGDGCIPSNYRNTSTGQEPGDNCKQFTTPDPEPEPAPTITSFNTINNPVVSGSSTKLVWQTIDATSCTILTGGANATSVSVQNTAGWQSQALTTNTTFRLVCENSSGSVQKETTVTVTEPTPDPPPAPDPLLISFTPQIADVKKNETVTFNWVSSNAALCQLSGDQTNLPLPPNGSWTSSKLRQTTQFSLVCFASDGRKSNALTASARVFTGRGAFIDINRIKNVSLEALSILSPRVRAQSETPSQSVINDAANEQIVVDDRTITIASNTTKTLADGTALISGLTVLDPSIVASTEKAEKIDRVEYLVDGALQQTDSTQPFAFDTTDLSDGRYEIKEIVYFKDGSIQELSGTIATANQINISATTESFWVTNKEQIITGGLIIVLGLAAMFSWSVARKIAIRHKYWKNKGF